MKTENYKITAAIYQIAQLDDMTRHGWAQKSMACKIRTAIDAFESFKLLKANAGELAKVFNSKVSGVDFRGCTKTLIAKSYIANDHNMRDRVPFSELVELFGMTPTR